MISKPLILPSAWSRNNNGVDDPSSLKIILPSNPLPTQPQLMARSFYTTQRQLLKS